MRLPENGKGNDENILNGLENNEFKLYLQFIVDNKTKKIVSGEALSRWDNPEKGVIGPVNYINTWNWRVLLVSTIFIYSRLFAFSLKNGVIRNTKVICEGVETKEQEKIVSSSDCDYIQGWYYAKPLPIEECETFIDKYKPCEI